MAERSSAEKSTIVIFYFCIEFSFKRNFRQAEEDGKLKYVPPYKVKNRPTLLALLKKHHVEGKGGVLLSELNDCIPNVEQHIKALGDQVVDVPTQVCFKMHC